ncbi:MAG: hypothetical protein BroJett003_11110 [Planctomycetota bacterium]|nr:MAG: hypothetical protein BroJett003_11110 [Planctomycetota bacterium]
MRKPHTGTVIAVMILAAAILHPPHGLGPVLCPSRWVTGLPCPGCGLSRSVSCAVRGMGAASFGYHPFGIPVVVLLVGVAATGLLPRRVREGLTARLQPVRPMARWVSIAFITAFIAFGAARMLLTRS